MLRLLRAPRTTALLRRATRTYARRRDVLVATLARSGIRAHGRSGLNVWIPVPDERQRALLKKMQRLVADTAASLSVAAEVIAPKKDLSAALAGSRDLRVFRGWRLDCVGRELLAKLENG